ncbi:hypothetical protein B4U80_14170 [Leptotrombidium deliense]|uniref:Uncharacterized protein n=1 Tax=Leptotrombidium deliense TaxID=299467 RepID=A0A443S196_9ACAR|nr:hypothetical protein B4U80_14170 [Leptotrombidium deliense]
MINEYEEINTACMNMANPYNKTTIYIDHIMDMFQITFKCCGWNGPIDWSRTFSDELRLPYSCCSSLYCAPSGSCSIEFETHYATGCKNYITQAFRTKDTTSYSTGNLYVK